MRRRLIGIIKGLGLLLLGLIIILTCISLMPSITQKYDEYVKSRQERRVEPRVVDGEANAQDVKKGRPIKEGVIISDGIVMVGKNHDVVAVVVLSTDNRVVTVTLNDPDDKDRPVAVSKYRFVKGETITMVHPYWTEEEWKHLGVIVPPGTTE